MSYVEYPKHGTKTEKGMWVDNRPTPDWQSSLDAVHTPACEAFDCTYDWITHYPNHYIEGTPELTWIDGEGWLCPTHLAELESENATMDTD